MVSDSLCRLIKILCILYLMTKYCAIILNLCFAWIYSFCLFTSSSFCYRTFVQTNYKIRTTAEFVNFFWPIARDLTVPNSSYDNFLMLFHSVSHCCFVSFCVKSGSNIPWYGNEISLFVSRQKFVILFINATDISSYTVDVACFIVLVDFALCMVNIV